MLFFSIIAAAFLYPLVALAYINPGVLGYWMQIVFAGLLAGAIKFWLWWRKKGNIGFIRKKTKADTLEFLSIYIDKKYFLDQLKVTRENFENHSTGCVRRIQKKFPESRLALRSSFHKEDQFLESRAGAFKTLLDVSSTDVPKLKKSIDEVFASNPIPYDSDQILVQNYVSRPEVVGVLFSRIPEYPRQCSVSFNDQTPKSTDITSGEQNRSSFIVYRDSYSASEMPFWFKELFELAIDIEELLHVFSVDIEFVLIEGQLKILQARPLVHSIQDEALPVNGALNDKEIQSLQLAGKLQEGLSLMTDWNPVEILGLKAKPLDRSLYRKFIADANWTIERERMGYRRLEDKKLFFELWGTDFVRTPLVFESLIPASISEELAKKILQAQQRALEIRPETHDEVEFQICLAQLPLFNSHQGSVGTQLGLENLNLRDSEKEELLMALKNLSLSIVEKTKCLVEEGALYAKKVDCLKEAKEVCEIQAKLFVQTARAAFIARAWAFELDEVEGFDSQALIQAATRSALEEHRHHLSSHLNLDVISVRNKAFSISSEKTVLSLGEIQNKTKKTSFGGFSLPENELFESAQLFETFVFQAIYARELNKRQFYWALDEYLQFIENAFPEDQGSDLEYLTIEEIEKHLEGNSFITPAELGYRKRLAHFQSRFRFPDIFFKGHSLLCFEEKARLGHFIGSGITQGEVIFLDGDQGQKVISHKVVVLERGEPGLDWVFNQSPLAVITRFGGPNSHVAIRCFEVGCLGLLGVDEANFIRIKNSKFIELDCDAKSIRCHDNFLEASESI